MRYITVLVKVYKLEGCEKLSEKMLTWKFMGQVALGIRCIPRSLGPEPFTDVPKYPELDPGFIFKVVIVRDVRA